MKKCCEKEIKTHIKKHRDVARCDSCKSLLLGYGDPIDLEKMVKQLQDNKIPFETVQAKRLQVVIKQPS